MTRDSMTMTDDGIVLRVFLSGERPSGEAEMAMEGQRRWETIIRECVSLGRARLLVVSGMTGWVSSAAVRATAIHMAQICPPSIERIAFVDLNQQTQRFNAFGQDVGRSLGLPVAVFFEEAAARHWLDA